MELAFALLSSSAEMTSAGKLIIIEAGLELLNADAVREVTLVAKFTFERSEIGTKHDCTIMLIEPDGTTLPVGSSFVLEVDGDTNQDPSVLFVGKISINDPKIGRNRFELSIDGKPEKMIPISIRYSKQLETEVKNGSPAQAN